MSLPWHVHFVQNVAFYRIVLERRLPFTGNGGILNPHTLFILGGVALTAIVLGLVFRPQLLLSAQKGEDAGIPWDTIYVILTGVIFIIIGVGLIFWVRSLALAAG